jgi:Amidohydrolase family
MHPMKTVILAALALLSSVAQSTAYAQSDKAPPALALTGGTLVDVSNSGHSTHDIPNSVVVIRDGRIEAAGPAALVKMPKNAKTLDYTGTYILPGLVDGFAGLNSQAQANAELYMGVTTVVGSQDDRRGLLKLDAHPTPHVYPVDSVGLTDNYSLLIDLPQWRNRLRENTTYTELRKEDTQAQIAETAGRRTRVVWLGHDLTAANTKFIISECHRVGLIAYGEFISTPFADGLKDGVDVLLHMSRYELGLVPSRLQKPLVRDPDGPALEAAYAYLRQLDAADPSITAYGNQLNTAHVALMPTLSLKYLLFPEHRNLWQEPAASILDAKDLHQPPDPVTGEAKFSSEEERDRKVADAAHFWAINRTLQATHPLYLAASGASALATMPGISLHTELELLVRLGLTPREALAAATSNYSQKFGWHELGLVEVGRRADLLVVTADPAADISNTRKIHSVILDGVILDRAALLNAPK